MITACPPPIVMANYALERASIPYRVADITWVDGLQYDGVPALGSAINGVIKMNTSLLGDFPIGQAVVMLHEAVHVAYGDSRTTWATASDYGMSEAAADSFATDAQRMIRKAYPCAAIRPIGPRDVMWSVGTSYGRLTDWLRNASAVAVKQPSTTYAAFAWRTNFLAAGPGGGRYRMLSAAGVAPPTRELVLLDTPVVKELP